MNILNNPIFMSFLGIVYFLGLYALKSYFDEKSKNLATQQDIKDITIKVEKVKTDYINQSYAWKKFFDFELENLKNVWNACWELQSSARSIRPIFDNIPQGKKEQEDLYFKRYKKYIENMNLFIDIVIKNRPFIPPEIYTSGLEVRTLASSLAIDFEMCLTEISKPDYKTIVKTNKELETKINELNEQIRNYIYVKLEPKK